MTNNKFAIALLMGSVSTLGIAPEAAAETASRSQSFNIPAGDLAGALRSLSRQARVELIFNAAELRGRRTAGVRGSMTPGEALERLLAGSGARLVRDASGAYLVQLGNESAPASSTEEPQGDEAIIVTGTRIQGAPVASPFIQVTNRQIREAGQADLGEVIRSLPSNFGGGQNPGVRAQSSLLENNNVTGGSTLNLRGLGQDATLTLLNGRRIAYDGRAQGIDVSLIPVDAVSVIQIVPDGSSAIYGSDAVGGVANVLLRRDFDGISLTGRLGAATDGGGFRQTYDVVGGVRSATGGFLAAYQYGNQDPIISRQREYVAYRGAAYLLDKSESHSGLFSGYKQLSDGVTAKLDILYSNRSNFIDSGQSAATLIQRTDVSVEGFSILPSFEFDIGGDWTVTAAATYSENESVSDFTIITLPSNAVTNRQSTIENRSGSVEIFGSGTLFELPGGAVRGVIGAGYRRDSFSENQPAVNFLAAGAQSSRYGFAELSVPLISDRQSVPLIDRLILTGAFRYEDYKQFGGIATPRLGLLYSPARDFDLKLSWGKSFKAPTLYQQSRPALSYLYPASVPGGSRFPAGSTAIQIQGGNQDLDPERARTWSATLEWHPQSVPGLRMSGTYFNINYNNRAVTPISVFSAALTNPAFAPFVVYNPTSAQIDAFLARSAAPLNLAANGNMPLNRATVVALIDSSYRNGIDQDIEGADFALHYRFGVGSGHINFGGDVSWLRSFQTLDGSNIPTQLSGIQFNPPKLRGRGNLGWSNDQFTINGYMNYIGRVRDISSTPNVEGKPMVTFDINAIVKLGNWWGLAEAPELSIGVTNIANKAPPYQRPVNAYRVSFDSLNYSAVGRFVSASLRLKF